MSATPEMTLEPLSSTNIIRLERIDAENPAGDELPN
jgi:hypothetical protein